MAQATQSQRQAGRLGPRRGPGPHLNFGLRLLAGPRPRMLPTAAQAAAGILAARTSAASADRVGLGHARAADFFWKAYLPIENTLNGKRPSLVHRPRAGSTPVPVLLSTG
jgi:hypothetical protein